MIRADILAESHDADDGRPAWSREEFEAQLRENGKAYHIHHPFNVMHNTGHATPEQIRGWVANRYYYQIAIPVKDAAIMANCPDREVRRGWVQRILDHDGFEYGLPNGEKMVDAGGIEAWIRLGEAVGLTREEIVDLRHVRAPWQEAVCSSLTELFAPVIHLQRLATWPGHYPWIESSGLQYFRNRTSQAPRDVIQGLNVTLDYFRTRAMQERAVQILKFKLDILWAMNDVMGQHYGTNGVTVERKVA